MRCRNPCGLHREVFWERPLVPVGAGAVEARGWGPLWPPALGSAFRPQKPTCVSPCGHPRWGSAPHHRLQTYLLFPQKTYPCQDPRGRSIGINLIKAHPSSVGARAVRGGGEGLYGRPRAPASVLTQGSETRTTGDHKGPLHPSTPRSPLRTMRPLGCFCRFD
jgi:hypothetical protein